MSKKDEFKKKMRAFVSGLSEEEVRRQLYFAYLQMEKCRKVLKGDNVQPVDMLDNGESTDLELFYTCVKVRDELEILRDACMKAQEKEDHEDTSHGGAVLMIGITRIK